MMVTAQGADHTAGQPAACSRLREMDHRRPSSRQSLAHQARVAAAIRSVSASSGARSPTPTPNSSSPRSTTRTARSLDKAFIEAAGPGDAQAGGRVQPARRLHRPRTTSCRNSSIPSRCLRPISWRGSTRPTCTACTTACPPDRAPCSSDRGLSVHDSPPLCFARQHGSPQGALATASPGPCCHRVPREFLRSSIRDARLSRRR